MQRDAIHMQLGFVEIMFNAAKLLEARGNAKGSYENEFGGLCTHAAVSVAQGLPVGITTSEHNRLEKWMYMTFGMSICRYNNVHFQSEVIEMLKRAAVEA